MDDCLFCKIVRGETPSTKVFETEDVFAFRDINPQAPVHVLIVPKKHCANLLEGAALADGTVERLLAAAAQIARAEGVDKTGFRVVTNCGKHGAQSVNHLHFHLLGGRQLGEQMV